MSSGFDKVSRARTPKTTTYFLWKVSIPHFPTMILDLGSTIAFIALKEDDLMVHRFTPQQKNQINGALAKTYFNGLGNKKLPVRVVRFFKIGNGELLFFPKDFQL